MRKKCIHCRFMVRKPDGTLDCRKIQKEYLWHLDEPYCRGWEKGDETRKELTYEDLWRK